VTAALRTTPALGWRPLMRRGDSPYGAGCSTTMPRWRRPAPPSPLPLGRRAVTRTTFALSQLSNLDYFHPNPAGQRLLADTTWRAAYWA